LDRRRAVRGFILALVLACPTAPASAAWHAHEEIPVENPVYRLVDDLAASYPVSKALLHIRPWTRAQLGIFLDQLVVDAPIAANDPAYQRLRRELEPGGSFELGVEPMASAEQDETSFELSSYLRAGYTEDRARSTITRDSRVGLQASLAFGAHGLVYADLYGGTASPGPHGTPDGDGSFTPTTSKFTPWYDRVYMTWQSYGFMLRAGHTWLEWGPGMAGTLGLSDAAPAMDLAEAGVRLPADARLQWFVASLDPVAETYLAGHRLEIRAGPSVEMGFSEYARFDGTSSVPLYLIPVVPFALLDRRVSGEGAAVPDSVQDLSRNNVMYTADFSWAWRPGVRFYGEFLLDDATRDNSRPLSVAWQAGLHIRRMDGGTAWSLRGDYTRVYNYVYSVYHGHDFAHAGIPTGFPLGPDCDQFTARLEWRPSPALGIGLEGLFVRDGALEIGDAWQPGTEVPSRLVLTSPLEQDQRFTLTADWNPSPSLSVSLAAGNASVKGLGHVNGNDTDGATGRVQASFRW
jgi:hypothetical protein